MEYSIVLYVWSSFNIRITTDSTLIYTFINRKTTIDIFGE